jgi:DNA-binding GntR family transcriptional regulator
MGIKEEIIPHEELKEKYKVMPRTVRRAFRLTSPHGSLVIGRNERYGWFIASLGERPTLEWTEKGEKNDKKESK